MASNKPIVGAAALMTALMSGQIFDRIPFYKRRHNQSGDRWLRITGRYKKPHQGNQEKARRVKQFPSLDLARMGH
jgi:hypothetical protein